MAKLILTILTLMLMSPAFAGKLCKVYGISDSPQKLRCSFPDRSIHLSCQQGKYFLNSSPVEVAFHMDVESGTVPLVFKSSDMTMTVLMDNPIVAELELSKAGIKGTCKRP